MSCKSEGWTDPEDITYMEKLRKLLLKQRIILELEKTTISQVENSNKLLDEIDNKNFPAALKSMNKKKSDFSLLENAKFRRKSKKKNRSKPPKISQSSEKPVVSISIEPIATINKENPHNVNQKNHTYKTKLLSSNSQAISITDHTGDSIESNHENKSLESKIIKQSIKYT